MKTIRIYTVNNKAVNILHRHTHTCLVQFIKSGAFASVNKKFIKHFDKQYKNKETNQLNLQL